VLDWIGKLYAIERETRDGPPRERLQKRQEESRKIIITIQNWALKTEALAQSNLGKAIAYMSGFGTAYAYFSTTPTSSCPKLYGYISTAPTCGCSRSGSGQVSSRPPGNGRSTGGRRFARGLAGDESNRRGDL